MNESDSGGAKESKTCKKSTLCFRFNFLNTPQNSLKITFRGLEPRLLKKNKGNPLLPSLNSAVRVVEQFIFENIEYF